VPFLARADVGLPLEAPTFWIMASGRPKGSQPNTLFNQLRSLLLLYLWADLRGVDLTERLREGLFLTLGEIIDLVGFCGRSLKDILLELEDRRLNVIRLATRKADKIEGVQSGEKHNRLSVIRSFLEFTSADHLSQLQQFPERWSFYDKVRRECLERLAEYTDSLRPPNRDDVGQREGLEPEVIRRLLAIVEPDHPENPFRPEVRFRNYLIMVLFVALGIRRGELLGIYVIDLWLGGDKPTVVIHRRPDDKNDERREKPAAKTAARILPLSGRAAELVHEWVVYYRSKLPKAKRNPFLIVALPSGKPMSLSNINKMFRTIRTRVPGLPKDLSPHLLRHTWNDTFSELADRRGTSPEDEVKWRAKLMGWRGKKTSKHYLRRTTRRRADEFLAEMQQELDIRLDGKPGDEGDDE
jgi:integrase